MFPREEKEEDKNESREEKKVFKIRTIPMGKRGKGGELTAFQVEFTSELNKNLEGRKDQAKGTLNEKL